MKVWGTYQHKLQAKTKLYEDGFTVFQAIGNFLWLEDRLQNLGVRGIFSAFRVLYFNEHIFLFGAITKSSHSLFSLSAEGSFDS